MHHDITADDYIGEFDGWPLRPISIPTLLEQDGIVSYVWPYEGTWHGDRFVFHKGTVTDAKGCTTDAPTKPLLVDGSSARAFQLVYAAVNETNKAKLSSLTLEHRGLFAGFVMDRLVWPNVSFGKKR